MLLGTGCLGERSLDGEAVREALGLTGLDRALLVVRPDAEPARQLAGLPVAAVRAGWGELPTALAAARATRCTTLVLDPPPLMGLEAACRALFDLGRRQPGLVLAVMTPASGALADPATLALLFEDLRGSVGPAGVRWWHLPSRALLDERGDVAWLDGVGAFLAGLLLDDVSAGRPGLPPGLGQVDFAALAPLTARSVTLALDVEPVAEVALLRFAVEGLALAGLTG